MCSSRGCLQQRHLAPLVRRAATGQLRRLLGLGVLPRSLDREALKALIERESARRLARLGGSEPQLETPPRRRAAL